MKKYECKNWSMNDIANAMKGTDEQGRRIVVPIFQRGKRWDAQKRDKFIDSLLKGYPVGTLLFAEQTDKTFSVIDGLQRSSTICEYILNPTKIENLQAIDEAMLNECRNIFFPGNSNITINKTISEIILKFIAEHKSFDEIEVGDIAERLFDQIATNNDFKTVLSQLKAVLKPWFQNYKHDYECIKQTEIPVIIYTGKNEFLNDIFRRINEEGQPLNDFEIYAATWDIAKYEIHDEELIENVIKKYDSLTLNDYTIDKYNSDVLRKNKKLTAFEFLFGFGKCLIKKYSFLNLESKGQRDDEVTAVGFELVDVCLNDSKHISDLADIIKKRKIDLNLLNRRINEAIQYVYAALAPICTFRGNNRNKITYLHPKYFILALIAFTFREMYDADNMQNKKLSWATTQNILSQRILEHYVFEIINNNWHDGGLSKMYSSVKERSFIEEYEKRNWESLLNNYFENELLLRQTKKFSSASNADKLILNCIYSDIFTVKDNSSTKKYDIEHLATKGYMKDLISKVNSNKGLPVSHIANLCYLPESINRGKKDKTIYEDQGITLSLSEMESKYTFTKAADFDFLYLPYEEGDANVLEEEYNSFLEKRFKSQKQKFYSFLGIPFEN